jgi:myo-inositol-1(or 4)-monophosphatase
MQPTLSDLKQLALRAGAILRDGYEQPMIIQHKGEVDLVTEIDHASEALILETLRQQFPDHSINAEESGHLAGSSDHTWYVDPLDGTINYAHGVPFFSVSIAYAHHGQLTLGVVYDPLRNECFSAERGRGAWLNDTPIHVSQHARLTDSLLVTGFANISHRAPLSEVHTDNMNNFKRFMIASQGVRRLGSAALDLAYVACGRLDGYWEYGIHSWDIAAGALLVEAAGGKVTSIDGSDAYFTPPYPILAAPSDIHTIMLSTLDHFE